MQFAALVEVAPTADGVLPVELIRKAYRASIRGTVGLVVPRYERARVDRVLDDVVPAMPLDVSGVWYVDGADRVRVASVALRAGIVIATSPALRALLAERRVTCHPVSALDALIEPASGPADVVSLPANWSFGSVGTASRLEARSA